MHENLVNDVSCERNCTVYDKAGYEAASKHRGVYLYPYDPYSNVPHMRISLKEAIKMVMAKVGVELTYIGGTPERVELAKAESA